MTARIYNVRPALIPAGVTSRMAPTRAQIAAIPAVGDLWQLLPPGTIPPIWDQGPYGTCTGHEYARIYETCRRRLGLAPIDPSRAFIYDAELLIHDDPLNPNSGAQITDGPMATAKYGCCDSSIFPYTDPDLLAAPSAAVLADAATRLTEDWALVPMTIEAIIAELAAGNLVGFGTSIFPSTEAGMESATGAIPMPAAGEVSLGGHALVISGWNVTSPSGAHSHGAGLLGYIEDRLYGEVQAPPQGFFQYDGSWGVGVGVGGRGTMSFEFFLKYAFNPIVVTQVAA